MAELFVGKTIEKLIDLGFEYLKDQVRWQTGMKEELERLQRNHPQIQAVVEYASSQEQIKEKKLALNIWLWQLRDAIDEADDVIDEFEYQELKKQLIKTEKPRKVRSTMKYVNERLVKIGIRALKIDPTLKRLEKAVHKLDEVSLGYTTFLHLTDKAEQRHQEQQLELNRTRETGSLPTDDLIGRDEEKDFILHWLKNTSNKYQTSLYSNISLLSIVGSGGMGKTALLQHVYKELGYGSDDVNTFDLKMWACVSQDLDVKRVMTDMLESATKNRTSLMTLEALQETLKSVVENKRFLLVLDDIWEEDTELNKRKWEKVLAPLASGRLGSKILATTRTEYVASMLSAIIKKEPEILPLKGLKDDEYLELFCAFANVENLDSHDELKCIAGLMVQNFSGSPHAARYTGNSLKGSWNESHWTGVMKDDIESPGDFLLKLSYKNLPKFLQNCVLFCCTFPRNFLFDKDDLIRMWIALGFIQPDRATIKQTGERHFHSLVQKSFFEKVSIEDQTYYKLSASQHEALQLISTQECLCIGEDDDGDEKLHERTPKTIRHLYVKTKSLDVFKKVKKFKKLRSFIFFTDNEDLVGELAGIFKILRSIRLIYINAPNLNQMAEGIGDLINLRYLTIFDRATVTRLSIPLSNLCLNLHHKVYINCGFNKCDVNMPMIV